MFPPHPVAAVVVLATSLLVACGHQSETIPLGGGGGQGGGGAGGGGESGCPPGHKPLDDGGCQPAGVPPERCGPGFAADDSGGCLAILPSAPCEPGTMALPGETECRAVAPCGSGRWGDIPIQGEESAQFVDQSYAGGDSDGSEQKPWTTIGDGIAAAEPNALVAVAAGNYPEMVHLGQHAVRLWGRCPSLVQIEGDPYALVVGWDEPSSDTGGTEIHNLGLTATDDVLVTSNTLDLLVDQVWIHDSDDTGLLMAPAWGPSSARVSRSLFEHLGGLGLSAASSSLEVSETMIRDIVVGELGEGRGIVAERISEGPLTFALDSSVIERATGIGIAIAGLEATIDATVVRDTQPVEADLTLGRGITIQDSPAPDHARAEVEIRQSVVDTQYDVGIFINGSDAFIEHTVVRNTAPSAATDETGVGIAAQYTSTTAEGADVIIRESVVEHSHDTGIGLASSTGRFESVVVRDTQPRQSDGDRGIGLIVSCDTTAGPGSSPPSAAAVSWSRIEYSHVAGISLFGSTATVAGSVVQHTATTADGRFGDGIIILGDLFDPAQLDLTASFVSDSERAGVVSFGSAIRLGNTQLRCNAIDLDGEQWVTAYSFEDLGGNHCGCEQDEVCHVMSTNLEAPVGTEL